MRGLFLVLFAIGLSISLQAQGTFYQFGSKKTAAQFAEAPQKFMSNLNMLRGFGSFLEVNKESKYYDNLVGFYEIGKDENSFLIFFITAELVDKEGNVVAKSNTVKTKMIPNKKTAVKGLAFPGEYYEELGSGTYELRLNYMPEEEEIAQMIKLGKPKTRFVFEK